MIEGKVQMIQNYTEEGGPPSPVPAPGPLLEFESSGGPLGAPKDLAREGNVDMPPPSPTARSDLL